MSRKSCVSFQKCVRFQKSVSQNLCVVSKMCAIFKKRSDFWHGFHTIVGTELIILIFMLARAGYLRYGSGVQL